MPTIILMYSVGPARAYTLRGKYRQFFLRVTENNVDEITLSNLKVSPDKTLDVVVETVREVIPISNKYRRRY